MVAGSQSKVKTSTTSGRKRLARASVSLLPERGAEKALGPVLVDGEDLVPRGLERAAHVERDPAPLVPLGEEDDAHGRGG